MMSQKSIYTASKTEHAQKWRMLREEGWNVNSTWIDEARDKESKSLPDLWIRCVKEASQAAFLILYVELGEVLKGALVEVGAALACGKRVLVVGDIQASWKKHPLVTMCGSVEEALSLVR